MSDRAIDGDRSAKHVFDNDASIPGGMYVLLTSGIGESRWAKTKDGAMVYYAFMNRERPVWSDTTGALHILSIQHSYVERPVESLLKI